jgi:cyclohexyl-isocyanide hydratase
MTTPAFTTVFAIWPGMTHLDFTGPHQVLSRLPNSQTIVASPAGGNVPGDGLVFADTVRIADVRSCDLICVPGGIGATQVAQDVEFTGNIRRLGLEARYITSVCTGSLILGAAGLLKGRRAACHWAWAHLLELFGATHDPARVARDGNIITGGGVTAGIDFAFTVLAEIAGEDFAQTVQLGLEYAPAPPFDSGHPSTASADVRQRFDAVRAKMMEQRTEEARKAAAMMLG